MLISMVVRWTSWLTTFRCCLSTPQSTYPYVRFPVFVLGGSGLSCRLIPEVYRGTVYCYYYYNKLRLLNWLLFDFYLFLFLSFFSCSRRTALSFFYFRTEFITWRCHKILAYIPIIKFTYYAMKKVTYVISIIIAGTTVPSNTQAEAPV